MSTALYRLYRPQKFSEVEGQPSAVDVLIKSISTGRAAHAYLFSGARGCGKTTVARLVAKALNCASPIDRYEPCCACSNCTSITNGENLDVIEIDGASNNGVEEIRELKSHVSLAPFNSRFKIYIIDEVHMLSTAAFNALLKTLEEPPEYVVFILATTEPHKIPVTIRSRCQHIPFHRISSADILHRLMHVCDTEKLEYESEALAEIARQADGALRDALSLLDQVMSLGKGEILHDDVSALIGGGSLVALQNWLSVWRNGGAESFQQLNAMFQRGASAQRVIEELFYISRNLWIAKEYGVECVNNAGVSKDEYKYLVDEYKLWNSKSLEHLMTFLAKLLPQVRVGMRTDVIVGVLMSRRSEILNTFDSVIDDAEIVMKTELKREVPIERKTGRGSIAQNNTSKKEVKENVAAESEISSAEQRSRIDKPDVNLIEDLNKISLPDVESQSPMDEEIWDKILTNLKINEFPLFCATLDSGFLYSSEQNTVFIILKNNYLFHYLSNERNSSTLTRVFRDELPECKLMIVCGEKIYEYNAANVSTKNKTEKAEKAEKAEKPEKPDLQVPTAAYSEGINVEKKSSALYDAAYNAMKYMRGEIVMHRIANDKPEELDVS